MLTGLGLLVAGCPSPNTYGTARTLPQGKVSQTVAAEAFGVSVDSDATDESVGGFFPSMPLYEVRYGLTDNLELDGRLTGSLTLGARLKYNFLRGRTLDLAIAPGVQYFGFGGGGASVSFTYLSLPFLVDINFNEHLSLVLGPSATYGIVSASTDDGDSTTSASGSGFLPALGVGLNIRTPLVVLQPEVTAMIPLAEDNAAVAMYFVGLGLTFGAQPDFSKHDE